VLFVGSIIAAKPPATLAKADGIVALTGGSQTRLVEALSLLEDGKAERLLISGVFAKATRAEVQRATNAPKELFECCVDLGRVARDTVGNASETADWATTNSYSDLIIVTDAWHMPRALLEIGATLPNATLRPYPVKIAPFDKRDWWKDEATLKRVFREYGKYLTVLMRQTLGGLGFNTGETS
jgi:uncharacterized SAM-binding protein YcdF (DUF218 family)